MKVSCVFFNGHVNLGGSIKVDAIDLRGPSKVRPLIDSMEYNPDNGEVVVSTTLRCASRVARVRVGCGSLGPR